MPDSERIRKSEDDNKFRPVKKLDAELQSELDEALGDMSIEDLLDAELVSQAQAPDGQQSPPGQGIRSGTVISIQKDDIFVELGGKRQGILPAGQFEDEPLPEVGQRIEFTIEGLDQRDGLLLLSRQGAVMAATWETLEEGLIVEGRVTDHNKGGLELTINGIDAFMPISQIERFRVDELGDYVNQRLRCMVTEVDRHEGKVIVSRRDLLDAEAQEKAAELLETLEPGQTVSGAVKTIMPYGAFVDIGGLDGLLHIGDMSYSRVDKPGDIVSVGDQVKVVVLSIDKEAGRISLGLKQAQPDPWAGAETRWPVGQVVTGRIVRLLDFGAFVELTPGVDGLIPIGELTFRGRIHHPREIVSEGEVVKARVMTVDVAAKRISLSLRGAEDDPWTGASVRWPEGSVVEGRVTRLADFGAFVELGQGVEGLVHISELAEGFVRSVGDAAREGDMLRAKVMDVDEEARRISLSVKQLADSPDYTGQPDQQDAQAAPKPKRKRPLRGGLE